MELMSFFFGDPFFAGDSVFDELAWVVVALAILNSTEVVARTEINLVMIICSLCWNMNEIRFCKKKKLVGTILVWFNGWIGNMGLLIWQRSDLTLYFHRLIVIKNLT